MWPWVWPVTRNVQKCESTGLQRSLAHQHLESNREPKDNEPGQAYAGNEGIATEDGGHMEYATTHTPI